MNSAVKVTLTPNFNNNAGQINTNTAIIRDYNSRWQHSTCNVGIVVYGYLDLLIGHKKLYYEYNARDVFDPWIFTFTYDILSNISWQLKKKSKDYITNWLIFPNDIENVTYGLNANKQRIQWINYPIKTGLRFQTFEDSFDNIDIDLANKVLWHDKCSIFAEDYLSLGDSQLSIFWLNIGIESFFEYKVEEICNELNIDKEILFKENYFDRTRDELKKINSSEVFDKIIWPTEKPIHLSIYKIIQKLFKNNILNSKLKREISSKYSDISMYRNNIFHGVNSEGIDIDAVIKAIDSYKWLLENFKLTSKT
ncbi:MAG: hypothetical protein PHC48_12415 [Prevotella sp.]|nr:hypothetical protein [Prevotella sp.]